MHIPDPVELMESRMEREMDKVDAANTYPCVHCERRFDLDTMQAVSAAPDAPLECGRDDCEAWRERQLELAQEMKDARDADWASYYP